MYWLTCNLLRSQGYTPVWPWYHVLSFPSQWWGKEVLAWGLPPMAADSWEAEARGTPDWRLTKHVLHTCHSNTRKTEAGGELSGQPRLHKHHPVSKP